MDDKNALVSLVDDDASFRLATRSLLRSAGFRVESARNAEEFLKVTYLASVRCLIVDVRMPGMGGIELQRRLVNAGYAIPTIFVTAHDDAHAREKALDRGAFAFLPKPFDADELIGAVRDAVARSRPVW